MSKNQHEQILQACACANLRTVSRSLTQLYNKLLEPTGLKITQYYMLIHIYQFPKISIRQLSEVMMLDQTTITRNVHVLEKNKLVQVQQDQHDARTKSIQLTELGRNKLHEATPVWLSVQKKIETSIGTENYQNFMTTLHTIQKIIVSM